MKISNMSKKEIADKFKVWRADVSKDLKYAILSGKGSPDDREKAEKYLNLLYPVHSDIPNPYNFAGFINHVENEN
jgi:hypothetical protein